MAELSESDSEIFITQNSFRNSETKNEESSFAEIGLLDMSDIFPNYHLDVNASPERNEAYGDKVTSEKAFRFGEPVLDVELDKKIAMSVPRSTRYKDAWAVKLFEEWRHQRNLRVCNRASSSQLTVFLNPLDDMADEELNSAIPLFLCEVNKADGTKYPPNTLHGIVAALQHYLKGKGRKVKFFNDDKFMRIQNALDTNMKESSACGLGLNKKQCEVISLGEEEKLWTQDILGEANPQQLLDTIIYLFGIHFALRGGNEHRRLRAGDLSQVTLQEDRENGLKFLVYREDVSKTNPGGIKERKKVPKVTRAFQNSDNPDRCVVRLYEKYVKLCPSPSESTKFSFYLTPLKNPKPDCWFSTAAVGHNTLGRTVKKLCKAAGISGYRTNHSLRATAATRLFDQGVDEQLICEKTGHRSNAVRAYKRTSAKQEMEISNILYGCGSPKKMKSDEGDKKATKKPEAKQEELSEEKPDGLYYDSIQNDIGAERAFLEASRLNVGPHPAPERPTSAEEPSAELDETAADNEMEAPAQEEEPPATGDIPEVHVADVSAGETAPPTADTEQRQTAAPSTAGAPPTVVVSSDAQQGKYPTSKPQTQSSIAAPAKTQSPAPSAGGSVTSHDEAAKPEPPKPQESKPADSIFLQTAAFLLEVNALQMTESALAHELIASNNQPNADYCVALARLKIQQRMYEEGEQQLAHALTLNHQNPNSWALMGHLKYLTGNTEEAKECYERTLSYVTEASDMHAIYLRLASIYLEKGQFRPAKETFLKACMRSPSCVSWLGVGIACYRLGELMDAEDALSEANILNNKDPEVWGYLSLVCLKTGRQLEAEQSYKYGLKLNLEDDALLNEINSVQEQVGFGNPIVC